MTLVIIEGHIKWHFYSKNFAQSDLFIKNIHAHLTSILRLHTIHLVFSTCPLKYKCILCTEKPVFDVSFQDFWWTNKHLICIETLEKIRCRILIPEFYVIQIYKHGRSVTIG